MKTLYIILFILTILAIIHEIIRAIVDFIIYMKQRKIKKDKMNIRHLFKLCRKPDGYDRYKSKIEKASEAGGIVEVEGNFQLFIHWEIFHEKRVKKYKERTQ